MSLLDQVIKIHDLHKKRQHLQRRLVFSEPVMSLSLVQIADNSQLERTRMNTDNTQKLGDLTILSEDDIRHFEATGYTRVSDIKHTSSKQINYETSFSWDAIQEIERKVDDKFGFSFVADETLETIDQEEAVSHLLESRSWFYTFLFEYALIKDAKDQVRSILQESKRASKKTIIDRMHDSSRKAESNATKISKFVGCSEQYVKDVLRGRIDEGLSKSERKEILKRDNHACRNCGSDEHLEVHHIIPVTMGGTKDESNLCTLCSDCHLNMAHGKNTSEISYDSKEEFWSVVSR